MAGGLPPHNSGVVRMAGLSVRTYVDYMSAAVTRPAAAARLSLPMRLGGSIHVAIGPDDRVIATYDEHFGLQRPSIRATREAGGAITLSATVNSGVLKGDTITAVPVVAHPNADCALAGLSSLTAELGLIAIG